MEQGEALHLALEDGEPRLQDRLDRLLGGVPPPATLHFATTWKRLNEGGIEDLDAWLRTHPATRLITIDTLKRVRAGEKSNRRLYDLDYDALEPLVDLSRHYHAAIQVVHHTRKGMAEDPIDLISGSTGLTAPVDGGMVLQRKRGQNDAVLSVVHRDLDDQELTLSWEADRCCWQFVGSGTRVTFSPKQQAVVELLRKRGLLGPKDIAEALMWEYNSTRQLVYQLSRDGDALFAEGGRYGVRS